MLSGRSFAGRGWSGVSGEREVLLSWEVSFGLHFGIVSFYSPGFSFLDACTRSLMQADTVVEPQDADWLPWFPKQSAAPGSGESRCQTRLSTERS